MKTRPAILLLCALCCCPPRLQAQVNLVPNPSFEVYDTCPGFLGTVSYSIGWLSFGGTPDYFNACATNNVLNIPHAAFGYQLAHSGSAMAGVITYTIPAGSSGANWREYIGTQLYTPLIIGQKYFISFYINYSGYGAPNFKMIASNKMWLRFSTVGPPADTLVAIPVPNWTYLLLNWAHYYTDSIVSDTIDWYRISGSFIADSAYQYVILGNFFDSAFTDTIDFGGTLFAAAGSYYYIDDVCVTTDSIYNETWTGLPNRQSTADPVIIYPNPASSYLFIHLPKSGAEIQIYNSLGQLLEAYTANEQIQNVDVASYPSGMYLIKTSIHGKTQINKFIRTKSQKP